MIRVKMKSISAGPNGVMHKDEIYAVDNAVAVGLVMGGYAEYETAMLVPERPAFVPVPEELKQVMLEDAAPAAPAAPEVKTKSTSKKAVQPWDK